MNMDINKVKNLTILKDSAFSGKETSRKGVESVIEEVPADSFPSRHRTSAFQREETAVL